jgi:hypothetical protein
MPIYKNTEAPTLELLYDAIAIYNGISLSEAQAMVDEYLSGQVGKADLLDDIQGELDWIPGEQDNLQNAIDNVIPGLAIPNPAKAVLIGLAENQKRILQEQLRELRAWRFVINNAKFE